MKKLLLWIILILLLTGCSTKTVEDYTQTTYALGTVITINLYDENNSSLMKELIERIEEIEQLMSSQIETSEVNAITKGAGIEPVVVSEETFKVIQSAISFGQLSEGRFDLTIRPILDLWQVGTEEAKVPTQEDIDEALKLVDYTKVLLDENTHSVYLSEVGMAIDLGGIAKGYVADELVRILNGHKVERAMINLGGNIYAYGEKASGDPYKVAIQTPYDTRNTYFGFVELVNKTVVTSGPYERYFEENGQLYHHIFDASTGYPTTGDVVSVSVVADSSMQADALSTLLFTMSIEEGLKLIESIEGIDCIYVDKEYGVTLSSGLNTSFTLVDPQYKVLNQ